MAPWITIALVGLAIIIYTGLFNRTETDSIKTNMIKTMEETIDHFVMEIEEENKQVIQVVRQFNEQFEQRYATLLARIELLERQQLVHPEPKDNAPLIQTDERHDSKPIEYAKERIVNEEAKIDIKQRYQQLFELHQAGKSMDYIAKKLGINKGEVQLIVRLGSQEEQLRV